MMVKERKLFIALRVFHLPGGSFFCACELPGDKVLFYGGRILYEKGEFFIGSDPEEVYEKAGRIAKRIFS